MIVIVALLATTPGPQDALIGDWIADTTETSPFTGQLEVDSQRRVARFKGETLPLKPDGTGAWLADLPDDSAKISLRWNDGVRGLWHQKTESGRLSWATPLNFEHPLPERWRAKVRPYRPSLPLLLRIERVSQAPNTLRVILRDPAFNRSRFMAVTGVRKMADHWRFERKRGDPMVGRLSTDGSRLTLEVDRRRFDFRRARQPAGLKARWTPDSTLTRPSPDADWPTRHPREAGFDAKSLGALVTELAEAPVRSVYDPMVHALLVARQGQLVVEEYFFGYGPEDPHDTRSAGKSLASVLAGAVAYAQQQTPKAFGDRSLCATATDYAELCRDPRKKQINLGHLLGMLSGLRCDDDDYESPGNEDRMQSQTEEPDWYRYAMALPMARDPGQKAVYCTAGINLVGAMLKSLTGRPTTVLFQELLAAPLNIEHYHHNVFDEGDGYFGGGIRLRPRDLLKFGELMRTGGRWKTQRVVSEAWVAHSIRAHGSIHTAGDYGWGWWR
ncbi:MAG: serine hydrolase, partial [Myxococcota bacterium]